MKRPRPREDSPVLSLVSRARSFQRQFRPPKYFLPSEMLFTEEKSMSLKRFLREDCSLPEDDLLTLCRAAQGVVDEMAAAEEYAVLNEGCFLALKKLSKSTAQFVDDLSLVTGHLIIFPAFFQNSGLSDGSVVEKSERDAWVDRIQTTFLDDLEKLHDELNDMVSNFTSVRPNTPTARYACFYDLAQLWHRSTLALPSVSNESDSPPLFQRFVAILLSETHSRSKVLRNAVGAYRAEMSARKRRFRNPPKKSRKRIEFNS